jgi:hypothetical protein
MGPGEGGEITQTLYAHMKKRKKKRRDILYFLFLLERLELEDQFT